MFVGRSSAPRVAFLLGIATLVLGFPGAAAAPWVGLVVSPGAASYTDSADSISASLQQTIAVHRVDLKPGTNQRFVEQLLQRQPRVIVVVGSQAVREVRESGTAIPLVYAMVLDPASLDLPAPGDRGVSGATGVSMSISLEAQFAAMRKMFPEGRKIGVLYDPKNSAALIERARHVALRHKFDLTARAVHSEGEVLAAARLLLAEVDGLWSIAASTVLTYSNARMLLLQCLRARRPFFAISESYVRTGALAAVAADPQAVGRRAAEMALHIAEGGDVTDLPPEEPPKVQVFFNRSTAGWLGLKTPRKVLGRKPLEIGR
jgi:putative ABC transport system substrate-binding protein